MLDAASRARHRADRAAGIAQELGKLADATEKLQAVLSDNQRALLNRIGQRHHRFGH